MVLGKIFGGLSIAAGIFFLFFFADPRKYQPEGFFNLSIILGIFFLVLGGYLLLT